MLVLEHLARNWWAFVLQGVIAILFGVLAFVRPGITIEALVLLFAIWALINGVLALIYSVGAAEAHEPWSIFTGILQIVAAIRLRHEIEGEWGLVLGGIASVVFGALLILYPGSGALAVVWLIGIYAVIFGITLLMVGFRLRDTAGQLSVPVTVR